MKMKKLKICSLLTAAALILSLSGGESVTNNTVSDKAALTGAEASLFNSMEVDTHIGKRNVTSKTLIPLGTVFGIKLYSDGVIVTGLQDVLTSEGFCSPAADAGVMTGDYIIAVNGRKINNNNEFKASVVSDVTGLLRLTVRRDQQELDLFLEPVTDSSGKKCGMWIRDSAAGIGTLTFCDPETGYFGGLGHGICDADTNAIIDLKEGRPSEITISAIEKGKKKEPGRIFGYFTEDALSGSASLDMGSITANDETGLFGYLSSVPAGNAVEVAEPGEICSGKAEILATLDETGPQSYSIRIDEVYDEERNTRNFIFTVTDSDLIKLTGGIIQGMSGSPVLQNGKIVGAVTHVLIDNPERGYGIFIENMLDAAG